MHRAAPRASDPLVPRPGPAPRSPLRRATRSPRPWLAGLAAALALAAQAAGQGIAVPGIQGRHVAYEDVRLENERPTEAALQGLAAGRTELQRNARDLEIQRMRQEIAGLRVSDHVLFGTPSFVRSTLRMLTEPAPGADAMDVVRGFLAEHRALFEIDPDEVGKPGDTRVARDFVTRHSGVRHLSVQQQVDGVDLFGARLKANVTASGELVNLASSMLPRGAGFEVPAPRLGALRAIRIGAEHLGIELAELPAPLTAPAGPSAKQTWSPGTSFRSDVPLSSERVDFPLSLTEIRPAWLVVLPEPGVGNTYETVVDAVDGTVLHVWNRLQDLVEPAAPLTIGGSEDVTFDVYTSDSPTPLSPGLDTPTGAQPAAVPRDLVTVTGASVAATSPNGWIDDGVNETLGNNVDAHTDLDGDDAPDLPRPQGSPYRVFDFPIDLAQEPDTYSDAAVTQLFYLTNVYHDRLYALGFDEPAGNFQTDNFGLGGVDLDPVQADAQDDALSGFSFNNANFGTGGNDGSSARMQMYLWNDPSPDVDGDLDADVVFHELSHGLSIRLLEGAVFGGQSGGMGEGWGDYFGISLNAEPTDDPDGNYAMGAYATTGYLGTVDNYYYGIRRYPYSTDKSVSPLTYRDTDPDQLVLPPGIPYNPTVSNPFGASVHRQGEIWCNALVACRSELWADLGFAANDLLMGLVVDGMKLSPDYPSMLEARDAILQADLISNGGADLTNLWEGFAFRGMGGQAVSPTGNSSFGVIESFDVPALLALAFPNGSPTELVPHRAASFEVEVTQLVADPPIPGSGTLHYAVGGGSWQTVPLEEGPGSVHTATLPPFECFDEVDYYVSVDTASGSAAFPVGGPNDPVHAAVVTGVQVDWKDSMEVGTGWVVGDVDDDATSGIWVRVDPIGTGVQPENDVTPGHAAYAWVTGQGSVGGSLGEEDVDDGKTTLTSPRFDATPPGTRVGYTRWYANAYGSNPYEDVFVVDISNDDGNTWVNLETVGPSGAGTIGGWITHDALVADFVTPTSQMRLRFIASDENNGSLVEAALDELRVFRLECEFCQEDLGQGGPGFVALRLCGPLLTWGETVTLSLSQAAPAAPVWLLTGSTRAPTPALGGTLVPGGSGGLLYLSTTDENGNLEVPGIRGGAPTPTTVYLQALVLDPTQPERFAISNVVAAELLP